MREIAYCYSCGAKLKVITCKTGTYNVETGEPNTYSYMQCPTMQKLSFWKRLFHSVLEPSEPTFL